MTSPRTPRTTSAGQARWSAAAVARRLGVAPATLRSWAVRYGLGPRDHQSGRYRRYTGADVAELEQIQQLRRDGVPMSVAVTIARERSADGPTNTGARQEGGWREAVEDGSDVGGFRDDLARLVTAVRALDAGAAVGVLDLSMRRRGVVTTWTRLCRPALALTQTDPTGAVPGTNCEPSPSPHADDPSLRPGGAIDAECVLTWAITTSLRRTPQPSLAPADTPTLLLGCIDAELHTLALDALLAACHQHQLPARMLGPSVPTPALHHAARRTRPAAVFVWAQTPRTATPGVLQGLDRHAHLVVAAGPGWNGVDLPGGVRTVASIAEALTLAQNATADHHDSRSGEGRAPTPPIRR